MFNRSLWSAALVLAGALGFAPAASAQLKEAFSVANPFDATLRYEVSIDGGAWETFDIKPKFTIIHAGPAKHGLPTVIEVRFDYILGDGKVTYKTCRVIPKLASGPAEAARYEFVVRDRNLLDLVSTEPALQREEELRASR